MTEHPLANYPRPPPRAEDLPYDDGEPMETIRHRAQMNLLIESLEDHFADRRDLFVGGNMFVYYSELQAKNNDFRGPDVFVVTNARYKLDRLSWVVWEEDGRTPDVVIELLSPSTEKVDRGVKMDIYARLMKVAAYYLYDPLTFVFEGYRLDLETGEYTPMKPDADGNLACPPLGLKLGVRPMERDDAEPLPMLRWITQDRVVLPSRLEHARAAEAEAERERTKAEQARSKAEQERARAEALAARVAELEAQLASKEGSD